MCVHFWCAAVRPSIVLCVCTVHVLCRQRRGDPPLLGKRGPKTSAPLHVLQNALPPPPALQVHKAGRSMYRQKLVLGAPPSRLFLPMLLVRPTPIIMCHARPLRAACRCSVCATVLPRAPCAVDSRCVCARGGSSPRVAISSRHRMCSGPMIFQFSLPPPYTCRPLWPSAGRKYRPVAATQALALTQGRGLICLGAMRSRAGTGHYRESPGPRNQNTDVCCFVRSRASPSHQKAAGLIMHQVSGGSGGGGAKKLVPAPSTTTCWRPHPQIFLLFPPVAGLCDVHTWPVVSGVPATEVRMTMEHSARSLASFPTLVHNVRVRCAVQFSSGKNRHTPDLSLCALAQTHTHTRLLLSERNILPSITKAHNRCSCARVGALQVHCRTSALTSCTSAVLPLALYCTRALFRSYEMLHADSKTRAKASRLDNIIAGIRNKKTEAETTNIFPNDALVNNFNIAANKAATSCALQQTISTFLDSLNKPQQFTQEQNECLMKMYAEEILPLSGSLTDPHNAICEFESFVCTMNVWDVL